MGRTLAKHIINLNIRELRPNFRSFQALNRLHHELNDLDNSVIEINCNLLKWMDSQLSSPFRSIVEHSLQRGNTVTIENLAPNIELILKKNGMLADKVVDTYNTTMPITGFPLDNAVEFAKYAKQHLSHPAMPKMSNQLQLKFFEGIDELFANCALHSKSKIPVIVAGQFYPTHKKLSISITDGGIGVVGSLANANYTFPTHADAIDWAMNNENTSRQGYIPGGLGLKVLREFVKLNGGQLIIASQLGYWTESANGVQQENCDYLFPGTSVVLEINTADMKKYDLAKKQDPNNIW